jgi:hypothetical protein
MAHASSTISERATVGIVLVVTTILVMVSNQRRLAAFVVLACLVPYIGLVAPFKCGGYT